MVKNPMFKEYVPTSVTCVLEELRKYPAYTVYGKIYQYV